MNINLDFCANSDKKISPNDNQEIRFPKSRSCHRISISEEVNDPDHLDQDNLLEINNNQNQTEETTPHQLNKDDAIEEVENQISLPYDVWELLSNYILPECIGPFSRICKDSYAVINQQPFWAKLYRDFIPNERAPRNSSGLKAKVIRHLFQTYLPLSSRLNSTKAKIYDPHTLVGLICLKHEWNILPCEQGTAPRRVHFEITFGKLNPPKSLWERELVSLESLSI